MTTEAAITTEKLLYAFTEANGYSYYPQYINIKSFGERWALKNGDPNEAWIANPDFRVELLIRGPEHQSNEGVGAGLLSRVTLSRDTAVGMAYAVLRELGEDLVRGAK